MKTDKVDQRYHGDLEAVNRVPFVTSILELICSSTGAGVAAVTRITDDKWVACAVDDRIKMGLKSGDVLAVETTLCYEVWKRGEGIAVNDAAGEPAYRDHPVLATYKLNSYISVPIVLDDGRFFGTLCAMSPQTMHVANESTLSMFHSYAALIAHHLRDHDDNAQQRKRLREEKRLAQQAEQAIAMLGHDLKNPISAMSNAAQLLLRNKPDDRNRILAQLIYDGAIKTRSLIDNMLDYARARFGEGLQLNFNNRQPLAATLEQVVREFVILNPKCTFVADFRLGEAIQADYMRIGQILANLLDNAVNFGDHGEPVVVKAWSEEGRFVLSVSNAGAPIPKKILPFIFEAFFRDNRSEKARGVGLGLFIAKEIARAHGGNLSVHRVERNTVFTLTVPAAQGTY